MKRRIGFVSNSSSSSFVLHTNLTPLEFEKLLTEVGLNIAPESIGVNQLGKAILSGWTPMYNDESDMGEDILKVRDMLINKFGPNSYMITTDGGY